MKTKLIEWLNEREKVSRETIHFISRFGGADIIKQETKELAIYSEMLAKIAELEETPTLLTWQQTPEGITATYNGVKITVKATGKKSFHSYTMEGHIQIGSTAQGLDLIIPQPEPTYRAWVKEEIPVGARVWDKEKVNRIMTILSTEISLNGTEGFTLPKNMNYGGVFFVSCDDALKRYEYFNGTSWQPCGVLE